MKKLIEYLIKAFALASTPYGSSNENQTNDE